ncbi:hypothetical protein DPMN_096718 [Dreissena polymorpha]|uniref:Uncharacterized protein n=1 Tax=Dreissena polymorpha TaxID=45954 RepID=A0A9D4L8X2_DREPO|nr:hypothetical protein DPMN_096718 [Dreissena polymorpha]
MSPRNPVTIPDIPLHSFSPSSTSLSKDMLGLYLLVLLVLEHKDENIMALKVHVHPYTSRLRV